MAVTDLNSERLRRRGLADTGRCACGRYRTQCRNGCLEESVQNHPSNHHRPTRTHSAESMMSLEEMVEPPGHHIAVIPLIDMKDQFLVRCECAWYAAEDAENVDTAKYMHWLAVEITEETLNRSEWPQ